MRPLGQEEISRIAFSPSTVVGILTKTCSDQERIFLYLAFNEPLFLLACLLERLTPRPLRVHLVGEYVAVQPDRTR
jgi:hypothetical protein